MEKPRTHPLSAEDKKNITTLYEGRLEKHGISHVTVGWSSQEQQDLRFKILTEIGISNGDSVLDVGCGLGDLWRYFQQRKLDVRYTGQDISEGLIEASKLRFPEIPFFSGDLLEQQIQEKYDWVVLSGALNLKLHDNKSLTKAMLEKMFALSIKGVACNFLTSYVDYEAKEHYHHKPEEILNLAMTLTENSALRHDYPLWEFTVYLLK